MRRKVRRLTNPAQRKKLIGREEIHRRKKDRKWRETMYRLDRKYKEDNHIDWCNAARKRLYLHPGHAAESIAWINKHGGKASVYFCKLARELPHWHVTSNTRKRKVRNDG